MSIKNYYKNYKTYSLQEKYFITKYVISGI